MVLSTTKKCQSIQSITNNTCILGGPKKGGLITMQGRNPNLSNAITARAPYCNCGMPLGCIAGLAYLKANNLMTMNPQCSGGVPHRMYRGCRSSGPTSGPASGPSNVIQLSEIATGGPSTWTLTSPYTLPPGFTLTIPSGQTLTLNGTLTNNGTITINGTIANEGNLTNFGTIHNQSNTIVNESVLDNHGTLESPGAITNTGRGTITNHLTGTLNVRANGNVTTTDTGARFVNRGTITVEPNATFAHSGGGTFSSTGPVQGITIRPGAPTNLFATSNQDGQVPLSWTAPSNDGGPIVQYRVQYGTDPTFAAHRTQTSSTTSTTVRSLTNGILYYFRVAAVNASGTGPFSQRANATPAGPWYSGPNLPDGTNDNGSSTGPWYSGPNLGPWYSGPNLGPWYSGPNLG